MHPYTTKLSALCYQCWTTYAHLSELRYRFHARAIQVCRAAADIHEALTFAMRLQPPELALQVATEMLEKQVDRASGLAFHYKQAVLDQLRRTHAKAD